MDLYSPGYPRTCYVTEDDLELLILWFPARVTGVRHHASLYVLLGFDLSRQALSQLSPGPGPCLTLS